MILEVLGFLLDILVLGFLGVMIFYSLRLSKSLNDFRAHRQEFDTLIIKLMSSIDQAERSIQNLKQVSARETEDLNRLIRQSKALSEELQIINEAGENMAKRLEDMAEKNSKVAQGIDLREPPSERYKPYKPPKAQAAPTPAAAKEVAPAPKDFPSFMVRDPEYPPLGALEEKLGGAASNDYPPKAAPKRPAPREESPAPDNLQSQAERDLYNALRNNKGNLPNKGRI